MKRASDMLAARHPYPANLHLLCHRSGCNIQVRRAFVVLTDGMSVCFKTTANSWARVTHVAEPISVPGNHNRGTSLIIRSDVAAMSRVVVQLGVRSKSSIYSDGVIGVAVVI